MASHREKHNDLKRRARQSSSRQRGLFGRWLVEAMVVWAWMARSRSCAASSAAAGIERGGEDWGKFP
jgi:hypothetical protein